MLIKLIQGACIQGIRKFEHPLMKQNCFKWHYVSMYMCHASNPGLSTPWKLGRFCNETYCTRSGTRAKEKQNWQFPTCLQAVNFHTGSERQQSVEEEKRLTIWKNIKEIRQSPIPALTLGLSGVIPFAAAPTYLIASGALLPNIVFAQLVYGASILSFLGGVRWGFTLDNHCGIQPNWFNLLYSVSPSLLAWMAIVIPETPGLLTLITGLGGMMYMDMILPGYPSWFKGLRFLLSLCAILSLWTTLTCKFLLKSITDSPDASETAKDIAVD